MITSNAERYPVSAQCKILGVPRATYYACKEKIFESEKPDVLTDDVIRVFKDSHKRYGSRRIKKQLEKEGITVSRPRVAKIMRKNSLKSTYNSKKYVNHKSKVNEQQIPNVLDRNFDGWPPRTHIVSDLTYVKVRSKWCYVCLLIDLYNREIVGHAASKSKDTRLVKSAFATLEFPLSDIEVFHTDRGSEFDNFELDEMLRVFEIKRSLSKKGCPYDNAVDESTNKILKNEFVYQETFDSLYDLQIKLSDFVNWYNHKRLHSTLGYMSPVEFRNKGLSL